MTTYISRIYTSSTLVGGKGGAGPSSHFTLRSRDQRSMRMQDGCQSLHGLLHGIKWIVFHGHLSYFPKPPLGGRPNTNPGDHGTPNAHNCWFMLFYHVWGPHVDRVSIEIAFGWGVGYIWIQTTLRGPWPHYMIWEVCWDMPLDTFFWALIISRSRLVARGIEWIVFHGHLSYFPKPPLGGGPNTNPWDLGTPNAHNRGFILFYHIWGPMYE